MNISLDFTFAFNLLQNAQSEHISHDRLPEKGNRFWTVINPHTEFLFYRRQAPLFLQPCSCDEARERSMDVVYFLSHKPSQRCFLIHVGINRLRKVALVLAVVPGVISHSETEDLLFVFDSIGKRILTGCSTFTRHG